MLTGPDDVTLFAKVLAAGAAIIAPIWGAFHYLNGRFDKKSDKEETERCQRHIERLYENAEKDRALTRDLHEKAMDQISENQTQLIHVLTGFRK